MDTGVHNKNKNTDVLYYFKNNCNSGGTKKNTIIWNKINDQIFMIAYISTLSMHPVQKSTYGYYSRSLFFYQSNVT